MEKYIVSALKYRPTNFKSVVGQKSLTSTLKNAIANNKLAHAYLFCGPRGVGKTSCARIFAKTINCLSPTADGEPCNHCESCLAFNEQRSYDIYELDAASNNSVDDIRQLVEQVYIPPQIGKYKVYIIDEIHMLSTSAFNAFLKTLEEPPEYAIFILATTEKHKIIPTILSRCQIYDFKRITAEDMVDHLTFVAKSEGYTVEPEALNLIALKADGAMRDALSIFDQMVSFTSGHITYRSVLDNLNVLDYEYYFRLTDYLLANQVKESLLLFNEILAKGFDGNPFITGLASHFRDLLVSKDPSTVALLEVGAGIRKQYQEQAQKCPEKFLFKAMKLCNDCDLNYRLSRNKRLLVELTLIELAQLTQSNDAGGGDDDEGPGPRPKTVIKPIFNKQQSSPRTTKAVPTPAPVNPGNTAKPKSDTAKNVAAKSEQSSESIEDTLLRINHIDRKKVPVMDNSHLGFSIKHSLSDTQTNPSAVPVGEASQDNHVFQSEDFSENDMIKCWNIYIEHLPIEQTAISKRMQSTQPKLLEDKTSFEMIVENEIVAKDFKAIAPSVQKFMRKELHNDNIKVKIRMSAPHETVRMLSRSEKFKMMSDKNKALIDLKNEFGLELF